jgi:CspA family cold shock protein
MLPLQSSLIAIVIGLVAGGLFAGYQNATFFHFDLFTCGAFMAATVLSSLATRLLGTRIMTPGTKSRRSSSVREQGEVKWFNYTKGFGFITRDSGDDIFVHFRSIRGEGDGKRGLREGQRVEFDISQGEKGLQADDVVVIDN